MKLLLDTHIWLWMVLDPERLSPSLRRTLGDEDVELWLSAASVWEMAIKHQLGRLPMPEHPRAFVLPRLARDGVRPLAVTLAHAADVSGLPNYHADPFDRLLVAQARCEGLVLATVDASVRRYEGLCLMVG